MTDPLIAEVERAHWIAVATPSEDERLMDAWAQRQVEEMEDIEE